MEGLELSPRQPDQRIAVPQRVVDERQRVFLRQRGQPERDLGQVDRHRIAVDAVEAALGDEPAGKDHLVLAGWQFWHGVIASDARHASISASPS